MLVGLWNVPDFPVPVERMKSKPDNKEEKKKMNKGGVNRQERTKREKKKR